MNDVTLILLGGVILGSILGISWFSGNDAPFVATKSEKVKKALKISGLKKGDNFYELGSGDGRLVIAAAKMGAQSFGIEQSILRVWYSQYKARRLNLPNAIFYHGDIFKRSIIGADVVFIYLLPKGVAKLETKLKKELKKGARVVTQTYHFPNWKPYKKDGDFWLYKV